LKLDKIYEHIKFSNDFSVEDWNSLTKLKLGKYFHEESVFNKNKELLRTELINYIMFCEKSDYLKLFEWSFDLCKECIDIDKEKTIKIFADNFIEISETDMRWMANVLTQPEYELFLERDKISYYFKVLDEILEGVFKPRLKLLDILINFKMYGLVNDNESFDLGRLIRNFPTQIRNDTRLFIEDPIFNISTNQWRNIAAHRSFIINRDNIIIKYGRDNVETLTISYDDFYKIVQWTHEIYRVLRLSQVLIEINYIKEIVAELGEIDNFRIRFESQLLHIIHSLQIVGFKFLSTEVYADTFCINVNGKINHEVQSSLIHASQFLDKISHAIYNDMFVRDIFLKTEIRILDGDQNKLASAMISINIAIKKVRSEIDLEEYLNNMIFEINNIK
jgi:hypothetical protein